MKTKNWWKESIMYQIYPRSFKDSNGDGIGDLKGIIEKLEYIASLGIDVIWLGPVYKTPNDDNGYDISDYYSIDPEFGTMEDFDDLLQGLYKRGIKLIMDLVVNHTSDEHDWFIQSKKSTENPYRDYYYWIPGEKNKLPTRWSAFFGGSAWEFDEHTSSYYLHLFTKKQPDLNWENPYVRQEIYRMMKFWLDKGIDGFRMDVISLISKRLPFRDYHYDNFMEMVYNVHANGPRVHEFLQEMHREVLYHYDIMTVGEGPGISKEIAKDYIGHDRNELNMIFQLDLMFMDHGPGGKFDIKPISFKDFKNLFREWDKTVSETGWNNIFLDNHDFPRMVSRFGNDHIYREKSTMLLLTFLMTMRGTPCIYMGSEIGMTNVAFEDPGDYRDIETLNYLQEIQKEGGSMKDALKNVHIQGRDNARVPMQWNDKEHAGFTTGTPWIKVNPEYKNVQVEKAESDKDSILNFFRRLTKLRKSGNFPVLGDFKEWIPEHSNLFMFTRVDGIKRVFICLNFSDHTIDMPSIPFRFEYWLGNYGNFTETKMRPWESLICKITSG
ncbi:MAG TPA: alpha-glucosidase [Saprospiraceae bacterium]|nr:alpha-glucosidase [Saprospiraceae bacterium]